jgi:uncharacterized membrane protein YfcA
VWAPGAEIPFLIGAGAIAGVVGSSGAIGSLISYPAVLIVGVPPLPANVSHAVAVVGTGVTSTVQSRPELRGSLRQLVRWSAVTAVGAAGGTALLLAVPGSVFQWVVPFLVALAAFGLLAQPRIYAWRTRGGASNAEPRTHEPVLLLGLFGVGIYDGYFGAASGIMTLAVLMLTVETQLVRANAFKNALLGVADVVAAASFIIFGPIYWTAAISLGAGYAVGGSLGPLVARRISTDVLRVLIATAGFGLAGWLLAEAITS